MSDILWPEIYKKLGVKPVINARSWVTNLGKERVRAVMIAYDKYKQNNHIINDLLSTRDSVYLNGNIVVNKTMVYQEDVLLVINDGTTLELKNSANIIIKGGLQINGTKNKFLFKKTCYCKHVARF